MVRIRNTRQKDIIEEEMREFSTFFTAEELYQRVSKRDPRIGIATVYRYLNDQDRENRPHFYYCDRRRVYSFSKNNHCHFECGVCRKVSHFDIDKIDFLKGCIDGRICHFQIDVYGICDDCMKKMGTE